MTIQTDFNRSAKHARELLPLEKVLYDIVRPKTVLDTKKAVHSAYGKSAERGNSLQKEVQAIWKILKVDQNFPKIPVLRVSGDEQYSKDRANSQLWAWTDTLTNMFAHPHIGKITDHDGSCTFTFYEFEKSNLGILTKKFRVIEHEHDLVGLRIKKNLEEITLPKKAEQILNSLKMLRPYARVVTGQLATKIERVSGQTSQRTALGKAVDGVSSTAGTVSKSVARTFSKAKARLSEAVSLSDPALVIGDRVIVAWE